MNINSLSEKQIQSFQQSDARINIFEGPVRAGKSFIALLRWLEFCRTGPPGPLVICGRTDKTIKRNIINPLIDLVGEAVRYSSGKGEVYMFDRVMYVIGANDDRAEAKIRGSEFAGALIDELTMLPENFVKMLLSRLSIPKASLFASTNPDSPFHWVKTDFIDREKELNCKVFSFSIYDNPSLGNEYIEELKKEYQGLWHKRYIEGKWVMAEGAVYDFFDEKDNCIPMPTSEAVYYIVGVDYGTTNPCVFTLIGYNPSSYPNMWLEKEYYYDSKKTQRQKSDYEYAKDLIEFIDGYNVEAIYIDPSAASFKQELRRNDVKYIRDAKNEVVPGIRFHGQQLTNGTLKICSNCVNTIREYTNYVWDSKASERGEDKPIKKNDHCFAAGSMVLTDKGSIAIETISVGDKVMTGNGFNTVLQTFKNKAKVNKYQILGQEITCTPSHRFLTDSGWKEISNLLHSDMLFTFLGEYPWLKSSNLKESNTDVIPNLKTLATEITSGLIRLTSSEDIAISTEIFGSHTMEKYHKNVIFITKTEIPLTIALAISNASQLINICPTMELVFQKIAEEREKSTWTRSDTSQKNGIHLKKAGSGIGSTPQELLQILRSKSMYVKNAEGVTKLRKRSPVDFVRLSVSLHGGETLVLIMNLENAFFAKTNTQLTNMKKQKPALDLVVQSKGGLTDVHNLHVEENNEYFVENILVHNCMDALRYGIFSHFSDKSGTKMTEEDAEKLERSFAWKRN